MNPSPSPVSAKPDSPGVRFIPPWMFYACLVGGVAVELLTRWPVSLLPQPEGLITGLGVALAGFAFMGWGHRRFSSLGVNVKTVLPASMLVTEGAYRFSRNPMYVGFVAILAGLGLAAGSWPMLLSALPMFYYLNEHVIPREEKYLGRTFGEEYKTYCRKVRRWL